MSNQKSLNSKAYKIKLNKGDTVIVRAGKYKGKSGKITATHPYLNAVTVEGINVVKRHVKPSKAYPQGDIVELTKPIAVGKVGILESGSKKPSRVSYKIDAKGKKTRVYQRSGKEIK